MTKKITDLEGRLDAAFKRADKKPKPIVPHGWRLIGQLKMEWRWNGSWRRDDEDIWMNPDRAAVCARELAAKFNDKLTAVRLINRDGVTVWQEGL